MVGCALEFLVSRWSKASGGTSIPADCRSTGSTGAQSRARSHRLTSIRGAGRIVCREDIRRPISLLPRRNRRRLSGVRHEPGPLDEGIVVDVARAIRVNPPSVDTNDELRLRIFGDQLVIHTNAGGPIDPHPPLPLEVDEQEPD